MKKKDRVLQIRISDNELKNLKEKAGKEGLSMSAYLRRLVLKGR